METLLDPRKVKREEFRHLAGVLGRAFLDDPFYACTFRHPSRRLGQIQWWMECLLQYGLRYGRVWADSGNQAAAIVLGPDHPTCDTGKILSLGLYQCFFRMTPPEILGTLRITGEWEHRHKAEKPNLYLMAIGVEPERQGKGLGGRLVRKILEAAREAGVNCYLETMKERNTSFYQRHGFSTVHENKVRNGSPYWCMRWEFHH